MLGSLSLELIIAQCVFVYECVGGCVHVETQQRGESHFPVVW